MTLKSHRIKRDHFDTSATGRSDVHCKIKETLLIRDLQPALNELNVMFFVVVFLFVVVFFVVVLCFVLCLFVFFPADFKSVYFHLHPLAFLSLLGTGLPY